MLPQTKQKKSKFARFCQSALDTYMELENPYTKFRDSDIYKLEIYIKKTERAQKQKI